MLVLPAPVGPVMTNSSRPSKSISWRSRKAVKPSIVSLSGRTGDLLKELVEQLHQRFAGVGAVAAAVVLGEQVARLEPPRVPGFTGAFLPLVLESHVQGAGNDLA